MGAGFNNDKLGKPWLFNLKIKNKSGFYFDYHNFLMIIYKKLTIFLLKNKQ